LNYSTKEITKIFDFKNLLEETNKNSTVKCSSFEDTRKNDFSENQSSSKEDNNYFIQSTEAKDSQSNGLNINAEKRVASPLLELTLISSPNEKLINNKITLDPSELTPNKNKNFNFILKKNLSNFEGEFNINYDKGN
jgi:hypothetical protein